MDLDLNEEQELLRDTVRGLCQRHAPLDVVRSLEDDPVGFPDKLWAALAESGILGLHLPEEYGGSAMSMVDAAVVYHELGRAIAPSPHFVSVVLSGSAILAAGSDAQKQSWLPRIAGGEAIVTPAWLEPERGFGENGVVATAVQAGGGWKVTRRKRHVQFAKAADALLTLARTSEGLALFLVPRDAEGVTLTQQFSLASDTQYDVALDGASGELVGTAGGGWAVWDEVMRDGCILLASYAAGGAQYAHELTTQYAKDRKQFDKPLGAFQALAHYLADGITAVDGAETLAYEAAWAKDKDRPEVRRLAPMAKLFACKTFRDVTAVGQQIFGGVGFTLEYDIQLYFRRAKVLQLSWWNDRYLEELIASEVLD
jgi:alkylation response protein AidB-like acyl-CoA dehydrogenase